MHDCKYFSQLFIFLTGKPSVLDVFCFCVGFTIHVVHLWVHFLVFFVSIHRSYDIVATDR